MSEPQNIDKLLTSMKLVGQAMQACLENPHSNKSDELILDAYEVMDMTPPLSCRVDYAACLFAMIEGQLDPAQYRPKVAQIVKDTLIPWPREKKVENV